MNALSEVHGQEHAIRTIGQALRRERLASAYLFEGPSGVGKMRAALALARTALRDERRPDDDRRIKEGIHPDVRVWYPRDEGDRNLQVDTIREQILPFTQFAPFEATRAFVVLPQADVSFPDNHPEGANALLKTLEEPRPGVHFVLLAERPDRLLVTIRSRCQRVRFARLPASVLEAILAEANVPEERRAAAIALADGRADRALALAEEGAAEAILERAITIDTIAASQSPGDLVQLAEQLCKEDLGPIFEALAAYYRDVAACGLGAPPERWSFLHHRERIEQRAQRVTPARAAVACARLREAEERLAGNANKEMLLGRVLFEIGRG